MKAIQYFNFNRTLEALNFYQTYFGATMISQIMGDDVMFEGAPEEYRMPEDVAKNFVMNAEFEILGHSFMASDTWEQREVNNEGAIVTFVAESPEDEAAVNDFFMKASQAPRCQITMPLSETEWAKVYGMFIDPYGVTWMINIY